MKFAAISSQKADFPVAFMCAQFKVSRSGYYAWLVRPTSSRQTANVGLLDAIKIIRQGRHCSSYGSPRVHRALRRHGYRAGRHRVARLMRLHGILGKPRRRRVNTTDSAHNLPVAQNLLNRDFSTTAPNQKWVGDMTYIATEEGWLYLAVVLDLFARRVVGWAMDDNMRTQLVSRAFDMAAQNRNPPPGTLFHSDQGSQYASGEYQDKLKQRQMVCSMSRRAQCWDNAPMESFFGTLKQEMIYQRDVFRTRKEAMAAIFEYIEVFYNRQRLHSTLGFVAPVEYEELSASHALAA